MNESLRDSRIEADMGQHDLSLCQKWTDFTEEMIDHWDWKLEELGASLHTDLETKGIMDLYKYILLFFALIPQGK